MARFVALAAVLSLLVSPLRTAEAQIISPGKLATVHSELDGLRNCTQCHQLRRQGASNSRCLDCHVPLGTRIAQETGYHASVSTQDCADCHKEHFGRDFDVLHFDTTGFRHAENTGFELVAAHADLTCRSCHTPALIEDQQVSAFKEQHGALERTYLGVATTCTSCHRSDDPHGKQFDGQTCTDCHGEADWSVSRFDHNVARYRLTGAHRKVQCEDCHRPTSGSAASYRRYRPIPFSGCLDCHADEHDGERAPTCTDCHNNRAWNQINTSEFESGFDHRTTGFELVDAHASADCDACHTSQPRRTETLTMRFVAGTSAKRYPTPVAEDCTSCHVDYHEAAFAEAPGGLICDNCHRGAAWYPTSYDIARHNTESTFRLQGAHLATPCAACHLTGDAGAEVPQYRIVQRECASCHTGDDPHQEQFGERQCEDCHNAESFSIDDFDHNSTTFPLDGAHDDVACGLCHLSETAGEVTFTRYAPIPSQCRDCHEGTL